MLKCLGAGQPNPIHLWTEVTWPPLYPMGPGKMLDFSSAFVPLSWVMSLYLGSWHCNSYGSPWICVCCCPCPHPGQILPSLRTSPINSAQHLYHKSWWHAFYVDICCCWSALQFSKSCTLKQTLTTLSEIWNFSRSVLQRIFNHSWLTPYFKSNYKNQFRSSLCLNCFPAIPIIPSPQILM